MSDELRRCTKEEIAQLKRIMSQGFIDSDDDFNLYKKFIDIKRKLKDEGRI